VSWAPKALCAAVVGGALLAAGAFARAVYPAAAELGAATFAPAPEPGGLISRQAAVAALLSPPTPPFMVTGLPSHLLTARFGYLTDLYLARSVPGGAATMRHVPAWEITFGGLAVHKIGFGPGPPRPVLWRDVTYFVDARYAYVLWLTWNHCAPCVPVHR